MRFRRRRRSFRRGRRRSFKRRGRRSLLSGMRIGYRM